MNTAPVIILAGGLGTRLRSITGESPKSLATIGEEPFLKILINDLIAQGFNRILLSCGYRADMIQNFVTKEYDDDPSVSIDIVTETTPLGTGGAIGHVVRIRNLCSPFFVINGDTFVPNGIKQLASDANPYACKMGVVSIQNANRYGLVERNARGEIISFCEKSNESLPGLINSGLYRLTPQLFEQQGAYSLERDIFPELCRKKQLYGVVIDSTFIDIGVPEDYQRFVTQHNRMDVLS